MLTPQQQGLHSAQIPCSDILQKVVWRLKALTDGDNWYTHRFILFPIYDQFDNVPKLDKQAETFKMVDILPVENWGNHSPEQYQR